MGHNRTAGIGTGKSTFYNIYQASKAEKGLKSGKNTIKYNFFTF